MNNEKNNANVEDGETNSDVHLATLVASNFDESGGSFYTFPLRFVSQLEGYR